MERISFESGGDFIRETRREVEAYLARGSIRRAGYARLYAKAAVAIGLIAVSWCLLLFGPSGLALKALAFSGLVLGAIGLLIVALLAALKTLRETKGARADLGTALLQAVQPDGIGGWLQIVGILAFAIIGGLLVAAVAAARRGGAALVAADQAGH